MSRFGVALAQIICANIYRLLRKYSKVKTSSREMFLQSIGWESYRAFKANHNIRCQADLSFGQERAATGLNLPKLHVCMVANCCRSTQQSNFFHEQGLQNLQ